MGGGQKRTQEQTGMWRDLLLHTGLRPPAHFPCSPRELQGSRSNNPFLPVSFPVRLQLRLVGRKRSCSLRAAGSCVLHPSGGPYPTRSARGQEALKRWDFHD